MNLGKKTLSILGLIVSPIIVEVFGSILYSFAIKKDFEKFVIQRFLYGDTSYDGKTLIFLWYFVLAMVVLYITSEIWYYGFDRISVTAMSVYTVVVYIVCFLMPFYHTFSQNFCEIEFKTKVLYFATIMFEYLFKDGLWKILILGSCPAYIVSTCQDEYSTIEESSNLVK